jgi:integrase/recombinase XerD
VCGKGTKIVLVPLLPAVGRAIDRAMGLRDRTLMLRHTFVTAMVDAGVDLRDVQIAARHADPRTTMRYDRARQNLDRHPNYILAAFMASGT